MGWLKVRVTWRARDNHGHFQGAEDGRAGMQDHLKSGNRGAGDMAQWLAPQGGPEFSSQPPHSDS